MIENRFEDVLSFKNLHFDAPCERFLWQSDDDEVVLKNDFVTPVVCKKYSILYAHDFSIQGRAELENVVCKYQTRIERLYNRLASADPICFVYGNRELNAWQVQKYESANVSFSNDALDESVSRFRSLMSTRFPNTPIHLVRLDEAADAFESLNIAVAHPHLKPE